MVFGLSATRLRRMEQPEKSIKEFPTRYMLAAGSDEYTQRGKSPAKKRKRKPKKSWNKKKVKQEPKVTVLKKYSQPSFTTH